MPALAVSSRAEVATITPDASIDTILTGGFAAPGDGGHDVLTRAGTADPGLPAGFQIQDFSNIYWKKQARRDLRGLECGIRADGSPDADAINDALDWLSSHGKGKLTLPAGMCLADKDIIIPSSNIELQSQDFAGGITLAAGRSIRMENATTEIGGSAIRRMLIDTGENYLVDTPNIVLANTRRCAVTDIYYIGGGTHVQLGDGVNLSARACQLHRLLSTEHPAALHGIHFFNPAATGDHLVSNINMNGRPGNAGCGLRFGGAGIGSIDGITAGTCEFTGFDGGFHGDFPAGGGMSNGKFNNILFDCGLNNRDNIRIAISGGTINNLGFNFCKVNAYHSTGIKVPVHITMSNGVAAGFGFYACIFHNSYREAFKAIHTGGNFPDLELVACKATDGSRAGIGDSSAMVLSGNIKAKISALTVRHGSGDRWKYAIDASGLTGAVPDIGPSTYENCATGKVNLSAAHAAIVAGKFWNGRGELV